MLERRDFLLAERGADRDREMASGIQHNAAALVARLQATGTSGVRAALGGSPVAYGSLRAAKCILTRRDCDVNSLTRRGTKSRSGHEDQPTLEETVTSDEREYFSLSTTVTTREAEITGKFISLN